HPLGGGEPIVRSEELEFGGAVDRRGKENIRLKTEILSDLLALCIIHGHVQPTEVSDAEVVARWRLAAGLKALHAKQRIPDVLCFERGGRKNETASDEGQHFQVVHDLTL